MSSNQASRTTEFRFYILLALTVFTNAGVGIAMPVLPAKFLSEGLSISGIGPVFVAIVIGRIASRLFSNRLIGIYGHKHLTCYAFLLYALSSITYLWADNPAAFITLRLIDGIFEGLLSVILNDLAIAYTAGISNDDKVKKMGQFGSAFGLGIIIGPLLGSSIFYISGYEGVFIFSAMACLLSVALTACYVRNPESLSSSKNLSGLAHSSFHAILIYSPQALRRAVFFSLMILIPLQFVTFSPEYAQAGGILFTATAVISTLLMPISRALTKKFKLSNTVVVGLIAMCISFSLIAITNNIYIFVGIILIETVAFSLMTPSAMTCFNNLVEGSIHRTSIVSGMSLISELLTLPLAILLPVLFGMSPAYSWWVVSTLCACCAGLFLYGYRNTFDSDDTIQLKGLSS